MRNLPLMITLVSAVGFGCGASSPHGTAGTGTQINGKGDSVADGGDDPPLIFGDGGAGNMDQNCGGMEFTLDRVAPNLFLVVDRSGSMSDPANLFQLPWVAKWDSLKTTLSSITTTYNSKIRFGLSMFPDPAKSSTDDCAPGTVELACAANTGGQVMTKINAADPDGSTPTAITLDNVRTQGGLNDATRGNYVVLVTDGEPNCDDTDVVTRINKLYNATPSVKTFVIGFGDAFSSDPTALNSWAVAGHTDRAGSTKYYQSNNQQDLQTALDTIAGSIGSCTFHLGSQAPDPSQLYVWEGTTAVPADATNGYTYDNAGPTLVLHGTSCDAVKGDMGAKVSVIYGCPSPPIN